MKCKIVGKMKSSKKGTVIYTIYHNPNIDGFGVGVFNVPDSVCSADHIQVGDYYHIHSMPATGLRVVNSIEEISVEDGSYNISAITDMDNDIFEDYMNSLINSYSEKRPYPNCRYRR